MGTWLYWFAASGVSFLALLVTKFGSEALGRSVGRPLVVLAWVLIVLGALAEVGLLPRN